MRAAGFVLAGIRKIRSRAHPPFILAHSLTSDFFGIEEREADFPDFESFTVWPATARLLWELHDLDRLAGQSSLAHFGHWQNPATRKITLCTKHEAKRAKWRRGNQHDNDRLSLCYTCAVITLVLGFS